MKLPWRDRAGAASGLTVAAALLLVFAPIGLVCALVAALDADEESWAQKQARIHATGTAFIGTAVWLVAIATCAGGGR